MRVELKSKTLYEIAAKQSAAISELGEYEKIKAINKEHYRILRKNGVPFKII